MNIPNCSRSSYVSNNHRMENSSYDNTKSIQNIATRHSRDVETSIKISQMKDLHTTNGIYNSKINVNRDTRPAFNTFNSEGSQQQSISNKNAISFKNDTFLKSDSTFVNQLNDDREMPNLKREFDTNQSSSRLTGSSLFNQRYQNVHQFPNYRPRKKGAFERKLKHCGLELDGEVTISILRQFLQPFIYRDINVILDEYIKKYFMKAFENIQENINITSENWSQILKCSISKSLYKQYCTNATIDPFDPKFTDLTDFPCFPTVCKVSNSVNQKMNNVPIDGSAKSDVDDCKVIEMVSDNNSDYSNLSETFVINQTDEFQSENIHCDKSNQHLNNVIEKPTSISIRKRYIDTDITSVKPPKYSIFATNKPNCPSNQSPKIIHPSQSKNLIQAHNEAGHLNDILHNNHSNFQTHNNYQNLPNNLSDNSFAMNLPETGSFRNKDISFFKATSSNIVSSLRNSSQSAMLPANYLNSSHNSIENNDSIKRYF